MAFKRLKSLKKRLAKDTILHQCYTEQMEQTIKDEFAEQIVDNEIILVHKMWCISHHPASKPKKPDRVRIVYKCAVMSNGKSPNDFLVKGLDLINSLVGFF